MGAYKYNKDSKITCHFPDDVSSKLYITGVLESSRNCVNAAPDQTVPTIDSTALIADT